MKGARAGHETKGGEGGRCVLDRFVRGQPTHARTRTDESDRVGVPKPHAGMHATRPRAFVPFRHQSGPSNPWLLTPILRLAPPTPLSLGVGKITLGAWLVA